MSAAHCAGGGLSHLVVGGGLAGSMAAIRLAVAGCEVTLLEREKAAHHKVCGEFLSREAVECLRQVGIDPVRLGAATIGSLRLAVNGKVIESALPFTALSLSRLVLDEALLARASELGCNVRRGSTVEKLDSTSDGWSARLRSGGFMRASTVFLASGKHDVRAWERGPGAQNDLVGFKLHWRLTTEQTKALRGYMDLFLFRGGYGGLSLVEGDVANFCLVVKSEALRKMGGWDELLNAIRRGSAHVNKRLDGAKALWERPLAVASIPYGYLARRSTGVWHIGDQAAVIPSFTGDGMSIALHSATLAVQMYLTGQSADQYHHKLRLHLTQRMRVATWLSKTMVTGAGRALAPAALSVLPDALRWIASATRIPDRAMCSPPQ